MAYCPYCGTVVKEEEQYCIHCGKALPKDYAERTVPVRKRNRWWFLPIGTATVFVLLFIGLYVYSNYEKDRALSAYNEGVQLAKDGKFEQAKETFETALDKDKALRPAAQNAQFMDIALSIQEKLSSAKVLLEEQSFQSALSLLDEAEQQLKNYDGFLVDNLLNRILTLNSQIQMEELKYKLNQKPTIQELKILLWESETIQTEEAKELTNDIRDRIVDYTYTTANESMKAKQYLDAIEIVEEGLRYAPNNEKLDSLKTTIEKEKVAFETEQQQRIQQAMDAAEQEYERNKNNAVEVISIETAKDEYGDLVVNGVIKSVATVPIYSISVEYNLVDLDGEVVESNVVFTYPDTLYPDEEGKFEFTHYDIDKELLAEIVKVQWFLDSP